jgi:pyruvate/2-oxoacid:ferredoxin oxidoreductase alpha subunit
MIRLVSIWPFAGDAMAELGRKCQAVYVPEMNRSQVAGEILKYTTRPVIPIPKTNGEVFEPAEIVEAIRRNMP